MPSKLRTDPKDPFGEEVALAYTMTTHEQRQAVAEDWESGKRELHKIYAGLLNINPDGLLIASLLQSEHPSVCKPSGKPHSKSFTELLNMTITPVDKSGKPVDNSAKTVGKPVDKMWIKPELSTGHDEKMTEMEKFSTGNEVIHILSTAPCV